MSGQPDSDHHSVNGLQSRSASQHRMVDPVPQADRERRAGQPNNHSDLATLRVIERLRHVGVGRERAPQLRVALRGRSDERRRGARPQLPEEPALRAAGQRIRAGVRPDLVEGTGMLGARPLTWLTLETGPHARAYSLAGSTQRWLFWELRAGAAAAFAGP